MLKVGENDETKKTAREKLLYHKSDDKLQKKNVFVRPEIPRELSRKGKKLLENVSHLYTTKAKGAWTFLVWSVYRN